MERERHPRARIVGDPVRRTVKLATNHDGVGLQWRHTEVAGRPAVYGHAGAGPVVVFLHGWGLDHRSYQQALSHLVRAGLQVIAPALPGFGGTAPLAKRDPDLVDYGDWVADLLDSIGIIEPVVAMGHSFGGGVCIVFAHRHPDRVRQLILINSIGGAPSHLPGAIRHVLASRPLWDWGLHLASDDGAIGRTRRVLPVVLGEAIPNMAREPRTFWRVAALAHHADLTSELEDLKARRLPAVILWGKRDSVITNKSFESLCRALGEPKIATIDGTHSWLIADPEAFGEIITNVLGVADLAPESLRPAWKEKRDRSADEDRKTA